MNIFIKFQLIRNLFFTELLNQPTVIRRLLLLIVDIIILIFSLNSANLILNGSLIDFEINGDLPIILISILISIPFFIITGQYKGLSLYTERNAIFGILIRNLNFTIIIFFINKVFSLTNLNLNYWILFWIIISWIKGILRLSLSEIYSKYNNFTKKKITTVGIYGAGAAAAQLAVSLNLDKCYKIKYFVDDSPILWGRELYGVPIYSPKTLEILPKVDKILLAIPSLNRKKRIDILNKIKKFGIPILQVPSLEDITNGNAKINFLKPISIEDLLGRDSAEPDPYLLKKSVQNLNILVTGAGGSIGSELCRQILNNNPKKLILLDNSEANLYNINEEISKSKFKVKAYLGSATETKKIEEIFKAENVDIVFHAAAYKHVPIVESNAIEGIKNNVFSTWNLCKISEKLSIKQLVLISTDKAVRPANVMGASKRIAELIVQAFAKKKNETCFSMVRFGNVLASSGSVVPLFKKQIDEGGPITLTHEKVTRFFMTISEASQLVLQASSLAKGGEVFLLNMGEKVYIKDLAEKMINLSGLKVKNEFNSDGDIEIITTGLRPGEKLYEELLIDGKSLKTKHPLIFRAEENLIIYSKLEPLILKLEKFVQDLDYINSIRLISDIIPEYKSPL
tara:strand:+ start:11098 stop:12975 length:1878 start_codon:yes stop_codon:yes gene_type:complete